MKRELVRGRLLLGFWMLGSGCVSPPPREGFTDIAIVHSRQPLASAPGSGLAAHWDSLDFTMLERTDVRLAALKDVSVSLTPSQDDQGKASCRALFTATLSGGGWCTSPTYNQGLGQVLELYFEKAGHALVLPWTMGAVKLEPPGLPISLRYEKILDGKILSDATEAEIRVQPCLWKECP